MIRKKDILYPLLTLGIIFIFWEFLSQIFHVPEYLLPRPSLILLSIFQSFPVYLPHFFVTFAEAILGFFLALIIGVFFVGLFELSKTIKRGFYPYIIVIRIAPVIAIAPFLVLWFGNGMVSKVLTATIMSVFFIVVNLTKGFSEVESQSLDLMKSLSASKWQILTKLKFPNAIPYLFSGLKMAIATSVAGAVVAEFVGANEGLGYLILTNFYYLRTTNMFAGLFLLFAGGILLFGIISFIESKFFNKYGVGKSYKD